MDEHVSKRLLVLLTLVVALGGFSVALAGLAMADTATTAQTLDRDLEPVIITGTVVSALAGFPVNQLLVYAYTEGAWRQIPAQVDEVTATGVYTTTGDGLLDANDEIVFMAKDLGDQAPADTPITTSLPISAGWYEIEVTDPISPTRKGWAYLVRSSVLTPTFADDYVSFNTGFHRINAEDYSLGFGVTHPGVDYLSLGDSGVEILDRTKMRLNCRIPILCPMTENDLSPLPDDLIKDGPVRVILRGGQVLGYGSVAWWTSAFNIPRSLQGSVCFSTDFNRAGTGATYYNAVVPEGVTVDGITDTVATEPLSPWWQLSTNTGTLIHVADTTSIGGTQFNYYVDNSEWDESDTGDRRHYGDTGVIIGNPNLSFTYTVGIYVLPGPHPNVGATYEAFFNHPLSVTAVLHGDPRTEKIYLPLIMNYAATSNALPPQGRDPVPAQYTLIER